MSIQMSADPADLMESLHSAVASGYPDRIHIAANLTRAQLRLVTTHPDTSLKVKELLPSELDGCLEQISHNELLDSYIDLLRNREGNAETLSKLSLELIRRLKENRK